MPSLGFCSSAFPCMRGCLSAGWRYPTSAVCSKEADASQHDATINWYTTDPLWHTAISSFASCTPFYWSHVGDRSQGRVPCLPLFQPAAACPRVTGQRFFAAAPLLPACAHAAQLQDMHREAQAADTAITCAATSDLPKVKMLGKLHKHITTSTVGASQVQTHQPRLNMLWWSLVSSG